MKISSALSIVKNQISAAIFGIFLLLLMIGTKYYFPFSSVMHRYDFIFLAAILFQIFLIAFRYETKNEVFVIFIFHILATIMELFKTSDSIGAWHYPEEYIFGINTVPLFAGFMYSAVGSYIARSWKIFKFDFINYPKIEYTMILSILIYINFFSHHFVYDIRWILFAFSIALFYKTYITSANSNFFAKIHILPIWLFISLLIYLAENIGTYAKVWLYPNQIHVWKLVSPQKILSWYLLMILSFVLISVIKMVKNSSILENYLKFATLGYIALILVVIANLNLGIINHQTLYFVRYIPGGDYTVRVIVFLTLALGLNSMLKFRPIKISKINLYLGTIFAILLATTEEISQLCVSNRVFDIFDILVSYLGIFIAHMITKTISKRVNLSTWSEKLEMHK